MAFLFIVAATNVVECMASGGSLTGHKDSFTGVNSLMTSYKATARQNSPNPETNTLANFLMIRTME